MATRADIPQLKRRTASLSVASNSLLIIAKLVAGTLTGSVAILTEAIHSSIDLVASLVAYVSVRMSGEPADESHRYGHDKFENLAALFEALLILVGSVAIGFESIRRLIVGGTTSTLWLGIVVVGASALVNLVVSTVIARNGRRTGSPALAGDAAHLRTDAISSFGVMIALILVAATGSQWIDPVAALVVASGIVTTGLQLMTRAGQALVDQALPPEQTAAITAAIEGFSEHGVIGFHELRTRSAGSRRYVDVHIQFKDGTSLEAAHRIAHELQDTITAVLGDADVLIHLEPEDRVRPGQRRLAGNEAE
jgi:cation diffusion facilitator family transporter